MLLVAAPAWGGPASWPDSDLDFLPAPDRSLSLLAEVNILAVLATEELAAYPGSLRLATGEPELALARAGLLGRLDRVDAYGLLRADFSAALRMRRRDAIDRPLAAAGEMIPDAALRWRPRRELGIAAGRKTPPFSRFRQIERSGQIGSAPPFVIDRIAPEARWGAAAIGETSQVAYAAGVYGDAPELELPGAVGDPSEDGRAIVAARVTRPIHGPSGQAARPLATHNPGHEQLRFELGAGALWRLRGAGRGHRVDASASAHAAYRRWAGVVEVVGHRAPGVRALGAAGEVGFLASSRAVVELRGDVDPELGLWSGGGGATYFATENRRNAISLYGYLRRPLGGGARRDALLLALRASL